MIVSTPDLTMGGLNFQDVSGALVKPAQGTLKLPCACLVVIAEYLLTLDCRIVYSNQPILAKD